MTGNRKMLLTLLATLAVSAAMAPAASADAFDFKSEEEDVALVGFSDGSEDLFAFDAGTVGCTEGLFGGSFATANKTNTTAIVIPLLYQECTAAFGAKVTVDFNGCFFVFHVGTLESSQFEGSISIACIESPKRIEFTAVGCTIKVPPQNNLKAVTYTNVGEEEDEITVHIGTDGLKYEEHNKGIFPTCADNTKAKTNGAVDARLTLEGEKNEVAVPIWVAKT